MIRGSVVAIVTPMYPNGAIDEKSLRELIDWQLQEKTDAIVVAGTTGEASAFTVDEQLRIISLAVDQVAGRVPVIAGTGSHNTNHAIQLTTLACEAGADAALIVTPYYVKPSQQGLYAHYAAIARAVPALPIILYNVPSRTACDLLPETVQQLSLLDNIVGIKEATGKIERINNIRKFCGEQFAIYSGDDVTAFAALKAGADGVISVTANIAPKKMHQLCQAVFSYDYSSAEKLNNALDLLHQKLFLESNPVPVKWALQQMDLIQEGIRLPLLPLDQRFHAELQSALQLAEIV